MRILVIEDNLKLKRNLTTILESQDYEISSTIYGQEGLKLMQKENFDLIVLDLNLPDIDGVEVAKEARELDILTPILMLTARIDLESKVEGLDMGADDYLTKPFESEELLARVRSLIRRDSIQKSSKCEIGEFVIDFSSREMRFKDKVIALSSTEFKIVEMLVLNRGKVCSAVQIYESVWGDEADNMSFSDTLKVHIARIRAKLNSKLIETVQGEGYTIR